MEKHTREPQKQHPERHPSPWRCCIVRTIKPFEEFIWEGIAIKTAPNKERAKSFIMESARKMQSLNEFITKIGIKKENANDCLEYSYDVMMFLSRAKMHLDGYAAKGSHEAE